MRTYLFHCDSLTLRGPVLLYLSHTKMANVETNTFSYESLFDSRLLITTYLLITTLVSSNCCYLLKKPLWFFQKVIWNWYQQHTRVFYWKQICYVWWTCFSTESRHTYGYQLCSNLFLYSRETDLIQELLTKNETKLTQAFTFTFRNVDDVLSQNNYTYWFCWSHLSHWASKKGYHRYRKVCFIPRHTPQNWQWESAKN